MLLDIIKREKRKISHSTDLQTFGDTWDLAK